PSPRAAFVQIIERIVEKLAVRRKAATHRLVLKRPATGDEVPSVQNLRRIHATGRSDRRTSARPAAEALFFGKRTEMQVNLRTDNHIDGHQELARKAEQIVTASLERFGQRITRVEVHLSDENSHKERGDDKRCNMEARAAGRPPVAVHHVADTLEHAIIGAAEKLERLLESSLGRAQDHKGRTSSAGPGEA